MRVGEQGKGWWKKVGGGKRARDAGVRSNVKNAMAAAKVMTKRGKRVTDAVDVGLNVSRHVEVDDVSHSFDISTFKPTEFPCDFTTVKLHIIRRIAIVKTIRQ